MIRRLLLYTLLLLPVLMFAVSAGAVNLWDVRWDANELPENGAYNWNMTQVNHAATATRTIEAIDAGNNALHILDKNDGADLSYYNVPIPEVNDGNTVEVKWSPKYTYYTNNQLVLRIASSRGTVQVAWSMNGSGTSGNVLLNIGTCPTGSTLGTNLASNQYYTYRLIENATGWRLIVVNASGTTVIDKTGTLGAVATAFEMGFGEMIPSKKCEYFIDYAYLEYGAYAPGDGGAPQAVDPYFVGKPVATGDGPDRLRFEWNTSSLCDTRIYYRQKVTGVPSTWREFYRDNAVTSHVEFVDGLNGGSIYEYYVESYDALADAKITSGIFTVDVPAQVRILYGQALGAKVNSVGDGSYKFEWRATMDSDSYVYYRPVGSADWQVMHDPNTVPKFDNTNDTTRAATTHYVTVSGFVPNTTYEWYAKSTNPAWGEGQTDIMTFKHEYKFVEGPDALPRHDSTTGLGLCLVSWETSLNSTEKVYYRQIGSGTWTEFASADEGMEHFVDLLNLLEPGQYEYKVESTCTVPGFGTLTSPVKYFETFVEFGGNLLTNPGFESGDKTGWTDFGPEIYTVNAQGSGYHAAAPHSGTYRLYMGKEAKVQSGGVFQTIPGGSITTGKLYAGMWVLTHEVSYSIYNDWGYRWTEYTTTHVSDYAQIGIDPTGGTDPAAASVVWSAPIYGNFMARPYVPVGVSANVTAGTPVTIFCKGMSDNTWKQHIVCMDDVWAGQSTAVPVTNVQVIENNPMSVTFTWNTPLPTTSMVQYSWDAADNKWWFAYDDSLVTNHQVTVSNMFIPDVLHEYRVQSISAFGLGLSNEATFKTAPNTALVNGDFEAANLAWNLDLGMGQAAIPWVSFPSGAPVDGVQRNGQYEMHGIQAVSPTHVMMFEEGYAIDQNMSGVYQRVKIGVNNIGELYMAEAKALTYAEAVEPWIVNNRVGIDPTGGTNPESSSVVWGPWINTNRAWDTARCAAIAEQPAPDSGLEPGYITIFLQTEHRWGVSLNMTAFDDVTLFKPQPCTNIGVAKNGPLGWPVDLGNDGTGMIVTKYEALDPFNIGFGGTPYLWVQSDDRSSAFKVNIERVPDNYNYFRGDRVRIRGIMDRKELMDRYIGELEIVAQRMEKYSEFNDDPAPVYMNNKTIGGGVAGLQRSAFNGSGANNVALLVKTTGEVKSWDVVQTNYMPYSFFIDDGSGMSVTYDTKDPVTGDPLTVTLNGLKIWHPYDDMNYQWDMPPVGSKVEITGVVVLEVVDPTPIIDAMNPSAPGIPNGSGDEILIPTIRMRDGLDMVIMQ